GNHAGGNERRAEVGNLDVGLSVQQDVGRLDVAVDDPGAVGEIQGPGAFENDLDDPVERQQGVRVAVRLERAAVDVFHHHVGEAFVHHRVVDLHDVRVRELAGERRFGDEQLFEQVAILGVGERVGEHHLDGDLAVGERIVA